jgi:7-cyano-7-deazaguanine tRNA-ribosyltransferase
LPDMSFELRNRDILGRIGRLKTRSRTVETPAFMPVINPLYQVIPPRRMREEFGCDIVITNSYIIRKNFGDQSGLDVHRLLDYDGVVVTDSGAYQILVYGGVEVSPDEIVRFQQRLGSDIAVILDIPTGWDVPRSKVEWTVDETLRRARSALPLIEGDRTLWVGPVQGGAHIDLVERSAKEVGAMPYQIHALGSPTEVMENYRFTVLVDMIMAARRNLPPDRPLHLFGAGHPMLFSLAVALGCDLFDSASYALYAKDDRYLTPLGTKRLGGLDHLPCSCPVCRGMDAEELRGMLKGERERLLAEHNLHVTMAEIDTVKQAIAEGTLWELMEARSMAHPALASAVRRLFEYRGDLEKGSSSYKGRGLFYFGSGGLARPEITRHLIRLEDQFLPSVDRENLLLIAAPKVKPFSGSRQYATLEAALRGDRGEAISALHVCFYTAPFGVVPIELAETYPLSQFEAVEPFDWETLEFASDAVARYASKGGYSKVIIHAGTDTLDGLVVDKVSRVCEEKCRSLIVSSDSKRWGNEAVGSLVESLKE